MKKSILSFVLILIGLTSFAQEEFTPKQQGNFLANGTIGIIYTSEKQKIDGNSNDVSKTFQITALPKVGYFVTDNLVVGLEFEARTSSTTFESIDGKIVSNGIAIGPFGRYYFDNNIFAELAGAIGSSKVTDNSILGLGDFTTNVLAIRGSAGYAFFIGKHVAIEPAINYTWQSQKPKDSVGDAKTILSTIFFSVGFTAFF